MQINFIIVCLFLFNNSLADVKIGLSKQKTNVENEFGFDNNLTTISPTTVNEISLESTAVTTTIKPYAATTASQSDNDKTTESGLRSVINYTIPSVFRRTSTNRPKEISTTTTTTTESPSNSDQLDKMKTIKTSYYYCDCDFQINLCDINCCCDFDCNSEILKTFNCQFKRRQTDNIDYDHGLQSCRMNEGWLCIFRRNIRVHKKNNYNPNLNVIDSYAWPSVSYITSINDVKRKNYYKIREPILIYNQELNKIQAFEFPYSVIGSYCNIVEPIRHLITEKRECLTNIEKSSSTLNILQDMIFNSYLLQHPINDEEENYIEICSKNKNNCHRMNVYRCNENKRCNKIEKHSNDSMTSIDNEIFYKIHVTIYHNFTSLITANVYLYFKDIDYSNNDMITEFWQEFEVNFVEFNSTQSINLIVGGPLGYQIGRPIIASTYAGIMGKSYDKLAITTDHLNTIINLSPEKTFKLMFPTTEDGYCKHTNSDEYSIKFGENMYINCFIKLDNTTIIDHKSNFVKICDNIQQNAFEMLLSNLNDTMNTDLHVSELGRPKNSSEFWQRIRLVNFEDIKISGFANLNENYFVCQNMIIVAKYKFFTERIELNNIPYQKVVKNVYLQFESRVDLQFQFSEEIKIPLSLSAMFYDLTDISDNVQRLSSINIFIYPLIAFINFYFIY